MNDFNNNNSLLLAHLQKFDTCSISNVVATYPENEKLCLGLYHPWNSNWYTDSTCRSMFPELGPRAGYAVTVTFGLPDSAGSRMSMKDLLFAIANAPKPVILVIHQNFPEHLKKKNGLCGGNMATAFGSLGVTGIISDGPSRDLNEVRALGIQYILTGSCAGHGAFSVEEINTPVSVCGMSVCPGEIIHMDENGAVKFPSDHLEEVIRLSEKLHKYEQEKQKNLSRYNSPDLLAQILSDQFQAKDGDMS